MYSVDPINFKHYSKIINLKNFDRLRNLINSQKENLIFGGEISQDNLKISPTLMNSKIENSLLFKEEIFGPILEIKEYEVLDEVIYSIKKSPSPLAFYLFSNNKYLINKCLDIPFGGGCINDTLLHIMERKLPFGGFKNSGIGNYHGKYSFSTFTHEKSVLFKSTKINLNVRFPNHKNYNLKFLKRFFRT